MTSTIIQNGTRAVVISAYGDRYAARLYVNVGGSIIDATATTRASAFKTLKGARRWAEKTLADHIKHPTA